MSTPSGSPSAWDVTALSTPLRLPLSKYQSPESQKQNLGVQCDLEGGYADPLWERQGIYIPKWGETQGHPAPGSQSILEPRPSTLPARELLAGGFPRLGRGKGVCPVACWLLLSLSPAFATSRCPSRRGQFEDLSPWNGHRELSVGSGRGGAAAANGGTAGFISHLPPFHLLPNNTFLLRLRGNAQVVFHFLLFPWSTLGVGRTTQAAEGAGMRDRGGPNGFKAPRINCCERRVSGP